MKSFLTICAACGAGTAFGYAGASLSSGLAWRGALCLALACGLTAVAGWIDRPHRRTPPHRRQVRLHHGV